MLHSERFADVGPAEAWAALPDEGTYLGPVAAFYRVLREQGEVRAAPPGHPPRGGQARADGRGAEPGVELGPPPPSGVGDLAGLETS